MVIINIQIRNINHFSLVRCNLKHQLGRSRSHFSTLQKALALIFRGQREGRDEHGAISMIHGYDSFYRHRSRQEFA